MGGAQPHPYIHVIKLKRMKKETKQQLVVVGFVFLIIILFTLGCLDNIARTGEI